MTVFTKLRQGAPMEKTLDVQGLTEDRIRYIESLIALWRKQGDCFCNARF